MMNQNQAVPHVEHPAEAGLRSFNIESQSSVPFDGRFLKPGALVDRPRPDMPLLDAICTRRTARAYADRPVEPDRFAWLVSHAMHAPTACNEQQWKVIYIDDRRLIEDLYWRGSASFLKNARQCFLLCYNRQTDNREWLDHIQSGAAFISTFQLLAHSIGIGSCWIGHLPNKSELRRMFSIHRYYEPITLVSFGYYHSKVNILPRKHSALRIISHNRFTTDGLVFSSGRSMFLRTMARYAYYKFPPFIRKKLKPYVSRFEKKFYTEIYD
jgi:nitroreductase